MKTAVTEGESRVQNSFGSLSEIIMIIQQISSDNKRYIKAYQEQLN